MTWYRTSKHTQTEIERSNFQSEQQRRVVILSQYSTDAILLDYLLRIEEFMLLTRVTGSSDLYFFCGATRTNTSRNRFEQKSLELRLVKWRVMSRSPLTSSLRNRLSFLWTEDRG